MPQEINTVLRVKNQQVICLFPNLNCCTRTTNSAHMNMKAISLLLVFLLLLQSCIVYNGPSISVEEAVASEKRAKVITADDQKLKFNRLENKNDRLIGITKLRSSTAKKLAGMPAKIDGKYLEVDLSSLDIEEIKLRDKSGSTVLTAIAIAGALVVIWYIVLGIILTNSDFMETF